MKMITVTMPIKEYERLKKENEDLKKKSIENYIHRQWINPEANQYEVCVDLERLSKDICNQIEQKYKITYSNKIFPDSDVWAPRNLAE